MEKRNAATELGWRVFTITPDQIMNPKTYEWLGQFLKEPLPAESPLNGLPRTA